MTMKLRELQLTQLEILKVIDKFCHDHDINYSLYAGSLLGAVRHQGFIPWDDDLDICMARDEYNRFIRLWNDHPIDGYILQNKENTPEFTQSFTKIRKNHTTFLQYEWERNRYHTGIFVDVFPIDRIPEKRHLFQMYKLNVMLYQLFTREFVPSKSGRFVQFVSKEILKIVSKKKRPELREKALNKITRYNSDSTLHTVGIEVMSSLSKKFPEDMLDKYVYLDFEDSKFMCFEKYDEHLKCKYGNYMELPPVTEREWKHHPIILDFNKNLDEID